LPKKRHAGYTTTELHRTLAGRSVFLNYAVWESVAHYRAAFAHPDFQGAMSACPSSAMASPLWFSLVAVHNLSAE